MRRLCPAEILVGGAAVALAVGDIRCHRRQLEMVTDVLRRPVPLACLTVLTLHAWDVLGPADPFRAVARLIPLRA